MKTRQNLLLQVIKIKLDVLLRFVLYLKIQFFRFVSGNDFPNEVRSKRWRVYSSRCLDVSEREEDVFTVFTGLLVSFG